MSVFRAMSCRAVSIQTVAMGTTTMQGRRKEKKNNPAGEDEEHKKVEKKIEKREREKVSGYQKSGCSPYPLQSRE